MWPGVPHHTKWEMSICFWEIGVRQCSAMFRKFHRAFCSRLHSCFTVKHLTDQLTVNSATMSVNFWSQTSKSEIRIFHFFQCETSSQWHENEPTKLFAKSSKTEWDKNQFRKPSKKQPISDFRVLAWHGTQWNSGEKVWQNPARKNLAFWSSFIFLQNIPHLFWQCSSHKPKNLLSNKDVILCAKVCKLFFHCWIQLCWLCSIRKKCAMHTQSRSKCKICLSGSLKCLSELLKLI